MKLIFIKIIFFTIIFTCLIYFINYNFFGVYNKNIINNIALEKYIEPEIKLKKITVTKKQEILTSYEKDKIKTFYEKTKSYNFIYKPENYRFDIIGFENKIINIIETNIFLKKIGTLDIQLEKEKFDRRGKMKTKTILLFGVKKELYKEYLSVFIHEFAHYIDLYFFEKKVFFDISSKFYEISWEQTNIKKTGQNLSDFVSGYAMTNKYEDFAETFTYYILYNKEFLEKTKKSHILKQKYDFFLNYLFKNKEFFATDFRPIIYEQKDYYWDITKLKFEENKLFNYLKKLN